MSTKIGPKIGIEGEAEFRKQISNINQQLATLGSEMKAITSEFGTNADAQVQLARQTKNLTDSIAAQQSKVDMLGDMWKKSADALGENDTKTLKWKQLLNEATAELNGMQAELKQSTDGIGKMADEAEDSTGKFDGFKAALGGIGAVLGSITAAAGAAAVAMAKTVVQSFGELEQNLGGSEAVFRDYAESIQKVGEEAYKNLGVSQSQYLATANKMGALFQGSGLEVAESYELTTQAMQRAADMASVMGIDMQMALDSVAGAAKGNFTMMDNLGVAMNATNIEAYALANGIDFVWKEASQADKARVAMQMFLESTTQYAGNFARESTETITGSLGLLTAATDSFVAGLGNADADMQNLTQNMIDAFGAVVTNVTPILENIVAAIPQATDEILTHIGGILPTLLDTVVQLFQSVLQTLLQLLPELMPAATNAVMTVVQTLVDNLPLIVDAAVQIILSLVQGITDSLPELIPAATEAVLSITETLIDNLDLLIDAALEMIIAISDGLIKALPLLIDKAPEIITKLVEAIVKNLPQIITAGGKLVLSLIEGVAKTVPKLVGQIPIMIGEILTALASELPNLVFSGVSLIQSIGEGVLSAKIAVANSVIEGVKGAIQAVKNYLSEWRNIGRYMVEGIKEGFTTAWNSFLRTVKTTVKSITDTVKNVFGIQSPSTVMRDEVGKYLAQGIGVGFENEMRNVSARMTRSIQTPEMSFGNIAAGMVNGLQTALTGISNPTGRMVIEIPVIIDGKELYRRTLSDLRSVERANPEVRAT